MTHIPSISPLDDHMLDKVAIAVERRIREGGRRDQDQKPKSSGAWVDRLITWGVGILLAWAALQVDVAVLKQRVSTQEEMLREVRDDIKTLLRRP